MPLPTVPQLTPGEVYTQGELTVYLDDRTDPAVYRHQGCKDPLNIGAAGVIWSDDVGNLTCQNCGVFAPAPGADPDGVIAAA